MNCKQVIEIKKAETSLVVQWLGLCASSWGLGVGGAGNGTNSIPGLGTKIPYATYMAEK